MIYKGISLMFCQSTNNPYFFGHPKWDFFTENVILTARNDINAQGQLIKSLNHTENKELGHHMVKCTTN